MKHSCDVDKTPKTAKMTE